MRNTFIPILFRSNMVRAILDGRKTETRRRIKSNHESGCYVISRRKLDNKLMGITSLDWDGRPVDPSDDIKPYCNVGDILWVRETWNYWAAKDVPFVYKATDLRSCGHKWRPSIYMPKAACRIWLKVTGIELERLQDISEESAIAEGVEVVDKEPSGQDLYANYLQAYPLFGSPVVSFATLWKSIHGDACWSPGAYVWAIKFERIERPNDFPL